jgi:hypothetical protein
VNAYHDIFVEAVARGRRIDAEAANALADGSVRIGKQAVENGLIDGIATIDSLLERMNAHRIGKDASASANTNKSAGTKVAAVAADSPAANEAVVGDAMVNNDDPKKDPVPAVASGGASSSAAVADVVQQERNRVSAILASAFPGQEVLAADLVASGASLEAAQAKLIADHKQRFSALQAKHEDELKLARLKSSAPESAGPAAPAGNRAKADATPLSDREKWIAERKAEFFASTQLQREFGGQDMVDDYVAYCEGSTMGKIRTVGGVRGGV